MSYWRCNKEKKWNGAGIYKEWLLKFGSENQWKEIKEKGLKEVEEKFAEYACM